MTYQCGPSIKSNQRQVLYGTILGGSSIVQPDKGKNCYLAMRDQDINWLSYKIEVLRDFFKIDMGTLKKDKNTFRCYSTAYPVFNDIYDLFYEDGVKRVTKEILEVLTADAWMVWFVDSGRKTKRKVYLRTHKFGEAGSKLIEDYFNSLDCSCKVHDCRGRLEVVFENQGSFNFIKYIAPKLPEFLVKKYD